MVLPMLTHKRKEKRLLVSFLVAILCIITLCSFSSMQQPVSVTLIVTQEDSNAIQNDKASATQSPLSAESSVVTPDVVTYAPASTETYVREHAKDLYYHLEQQGLNHPSGCTIFTNTSATSMHSQLSTLRAEWKVYANKLQSFTSLPEDIRVTMRRQQETQLDESEEAMIARVCRRLALDESGDLAAIFPSGQLSHFTHQGYVEPLLPPMRHVEFCFNRTLQNLMRIDYLVHDFVTICRSSLRPHTRTVYLDLGASLNFHNRTKKKLVPPSLRLLQLYRKFGIHFDHIYAYELTPTDATAVQQAIPDEFWQAFHWINVGISAQPGHAHNPWVVLEKHFTKDDFVVVKLDVDYTDIEVPLAHALLKEARAAAGLIDQFYFEHHVYLRELEPFWLTSMRGTVQDSLELFGNFRQQGIAAHFWV